MKTGKKTLIRELTRTVLGLSTAMLAMWFFFYTNMHYVVHKYVMQNTEQVSEQIITELNRSFLQLEEVSFALSRDENVRNFMLEEDRVAFIEKAGGIADTIGKFSKDTTFMDNIVLYNDQNKFYRFSGNISNTGIRRLINVIQKDGLNKHIQVYIDEVNYIGYVTGIRQENVNIGTIVMLTDENNIYRLFRQMTEDDDMKIALAAGGRVILSDEESLVGLLTKDVDKDTGYMVYEQVGFTPFELMISYEDSNHSMNILFGIAMLFMAVLLLLLLRVFRDFWKRKFFVPIQAVISEVEDFEGGNGAAIPATGMAHFDGLVQGINDMVERIEQKEKEVYEAAYSLQEAELNKQKALIISLKKQISAHFTVNVLNIIKALSSMGENEKAGYMCDGLSFLLRYANAGDSYISGMEEFFVLKKYTDIMEIRYPDQFAAEIDLEDALEEIEFPRMLLQPIVENSILHGLAGERKGKKGKVHVYSQIKKEYVNIYVEDNGKGMDLEQLNKLRSDIAGVNQDNVETEGLSHVALLNIQRRIAFYFGEEYGLTIDSVKGEGTSVILRLPIRRRRL